MSEANYISHVFWGDCTITFELNAGTRDRIPFSAWVHARILVMIRPTVHKIQFLKFLNFRMISD
jgi:hypothetical protein